MKKSINIALFVTSIILILIIIVGCCPEINFVQFYIYDKIVLPCFLSYIISVMIYFITSVLPKAIDCSNAQKVMKTEITTYFNRMHEYIDVIGILIKDPCNDYSDVVFYKTTSIVPKSSNSWGTMVKKRRYVHSVKIILDKQIARIKNNYFYNLLDEKIISLLNEVSENNVLKNYLRMEDIEFNKQGNFTEQEAALSRLQENFYSAKKHKLISDIIIEELSNEEKAIVLKSINDAPNFESAELSPRVCLKKTNDNGENKIK